MAKCKHSQQYSDKQVRCCKDGSIRTVGKGCPCKAYAETWWQKLKSKLFKRGK